MLSALFCVYVWYVHYRAGSKKGGERGGRKGGLKWGGRGEGEGPRFLQMVFGAGINGVWINLYSRLFRLIEESQRVLLFLT